MAPYTLLWVLLNLSYLPWVKPQGPLAVMYGAATAIFVFSWVAVLASEKVEDRATKKAAFAAAGGAGLAMQGCMLLSSHPLSVNMTGTEASLVAVHFLLGIVNLMCWVVGTFSYRAKGSETVGPAPKDSKPK